MCALSFNIFLSLRYTHTVHLKKNSNYSPSDIRIYSSGYIVEVLNSPQKTMTMMLTIIAVQYNIYNIQEHGGVTDVHNHT